MLQQLATETGAQPWVIASMIFFVSVFVVAVYRIWRTSAADAEGFARLPLNDDVHAAPECRREHGDEDSLAPSNVDLS